MERVDLLTCDAQGAEQLCLADISFYPQTPEVIFEQTIPYAKAAASGTMVARLAAVEDGTPERLLGEYTFNHKRALLGPGI